MLVKHILENNIEGCFKLQPQSALAKPAALVPDTDEKLPKIDEMANHGQIASDDNTLLKYLELSKKSTFFDGRTPFTLTRTIARQADGSFGFEISWSQPPRINSVKDHIESIQKGDFIIFVGETNVGDGGYDLGEEGSRRGVLLLLENYRSTD